MSSNKEEILLQKQESNFQVHETAKRPFPRHMWSLCHSQRETGQPLVSKIQVKLCSIQLISTVTTFDWKRKLKSWFAWCLACQSRREGRCRILGGEISSWMFFLQSLLGKTSNLYQLLWTFIESKSPLSLSFMPHFLWILFLVGQESLHL